MQRLVKSGADFFFEESVWSEGGFEAYCILYSLSQQYNLASSLKSLGESGGSHGQLEKMTSSAQILRLGG